MNVETKVKNYLARIKKEDGKIKAFLQLNPHVLEEARAVDAKKKKGRLAGYVIAVKSNIHVKGLTCSCASKTLENYTATYDATVIERIKAEDGVIIGMTNCDEFACGSSGETSAFQITDNPAARGFVPGGSSSGSAAAVAAEFCDVALGSDTGGSIRVPASFCGVIGIKPSYGAVSRYGLIDLSMSLDQIGPLARTLEEAFLVLDVMKGKDERDSTSMSYTPGTFAGKIRCGNVVLKGVDPQVSTVIEKAMTRVARDSQWSVEDVSLRYIDLAVQTYHPIVWTELFSASRRFDGRKYGKNIEDSAGEEVLRRILGGSEISRAEFEGRYYHKALGVKHLVAQEFERVFEKVDCLIMPTASVLPWKLGTEITPEEMYAVDALAIPANLAGVCALSIPVGMSNGKPVGLQIVCAKGKEDLLHSIAKSVESILAT
jgi:aspartyl-tRNA(Asn)/glutamyl-tRNA(Gln) amidotransferase subunit A